MVDELQRSVAVIGLGFVGLPLSQLFLQKGFIVHGIDINKQRLKNISQGATNNPDADDHYIKTCFENKRLHLYDSGVGVSTAEAIFICVPTPLTEEGLPNLTYVNKAMDSILPYLKEGQLLCLESTTYPGTTDELLLPKLVKKGFKIGENFYLAYSPERINPGSHVPLHQIPKVVGGKTQKCLERISEIYENLFFKVFRVSSLRAAEMTKLLENTQRFINISFINDFARLCEKMNIDVFEVIEAASTKPYGFTPYTPSAGIGGHCIPIDPIYLSWKAKDYGSDTPFIKLAAEINHDMPIYIANKIKELTSTEEDTSILVVGVTYKKDINDIRESPVLTVMEKLQNDGIQFDYFDPYVPSINVGSKLYHSVSESALECDHYQAVIVLTEHSSLPYEKLNSHGSKLYFIRDLFRS